MDPRTVLDFWFGTDGSPETGTVRELWFTKSEATDAQIRERFGATIDAALRGDLDHWALSADGTLALILVLDQFTRNVFRDTPRSFAGDAAALGYARRLVYSGADRLFGTLQRWFIYMPFEHSEDRVDQYESLRLFAALADDGEGAPLDWARKHFDVIRRFGRFPHRNAILGRTSTAEETEFLSRPGSRF
jgi:uncharacterized protein (DUF924 family)